MPSTQKSIGYREFRKIAAKKAGRPWSNAKRSTCLSGHKHPSKLEQRTCDALRLEYQNEPEEFVTVHTSLPLMSLMRPDPCKLESANVDFVVWRRDSFRSAWAVLRLIEAKGRASREWKRTKAALEASYGVQVEVVTR